MVVEEVSPGSTGSRSDDSDGKQRSKKDKKKKLDRSALAKLHEITLSDEEIDVEFGEGPLGLQILDVPDRGVLVWHLDGQALKVENLKIGSQVVAVGNLDCRDLRMEQVFDLVAKGQRPLKIRFRLPATVETPKPAAKQPGVVGTQMRLDRVDKRVSNRLRKFSVDGSLAVDTATTQSSPAKKKNDTVTVVFQKGPLGLQISDVGKRVLVTSFENNPDGTPGQAEQSGLIHFGSQIIRVGKEPCEGMSMHQIGMLVAKHKRPVAIEFRKLYEKKREDQKARAQKRIKSPVTAKISTEHSTTAANENGANNTNIEEPRSAPLPERSGDIHGNGLLSSVALSGSSNRCECTPEARAARKLDSDPMFFHFQLLCKAAQIRILLDYEESTAHDDPGSHPAFELASLHMPTLYKKVLKEGLTFPDWPVWIRQKYIEAYLLEQQQQNNNDVDDDDSNNGHTIQQQEQQQQEGDLGSAEPCSFCKAQMALSDEARKLEDEMFIHFMLLFRTIKIQAENEKIDQQAYIDYLDEIDIELLYQSCQQDGVSLHDWMDWIKKQCVWGYEEQLYKLALSGDTEIDLRDMIQENKPI